MEKSIEIKKAKKAADKATDHNLESKISPIEIKQKVEVLKTILKDSEMKKRFVQHASQEIIEALEIGLYLTKEEIEALLHPMRMDTIDHAFILLSGQEAPDWATKRLNINDLFASKW